MIIHYRPVNNWSKRFQQEGDLWIETENRSPSLMDVGGSCQFNVFGKRDFAYLQRN